MDNKCYQTDRHHFKFVLAVTFALKSYQFAGCTKNLENWRFSLHYVSIRLVFNCSQLRSNKTYEMQKRNYRNETSVTKNQTALTTAETTITKKTKLTMWYIVNLSVVSVMVAFVSAAFVSAAFMVSILRFRF